MRLLLKNSISKIGIYLPFIISGGFILWMIFHYGVNTPFWDQWSMVPLLQKMYNHTLSFFNLWHQYNEHRIFFPLVFLMVSAYFTHWNIFFELIINFCFAVFTATLLALLLKKSFSRQILPIIASVFASLWFFSPIQWENWLWGWQLEWFMCVFGAIAAIFLIMKQSDSINGRKNALFSLAILSGIVSSYSLSSGIVVWLVGLFELVFLKQSRKYIFTWLGSGLIATFLYYYHYVFPVKGDRLTISFFVHHIIGFVGFFLTYLGSPVGLQGSYGAMYIGGLIFIILLPIIYFVWMDRVMLKKYLPWLSLALFSILSGLTITVGRLFLGISEALASRYTTISVIYIISITILGLLLLDDEHIRKKIKIISVSTILIVSTVFLILSYTVGISGFSGRSLALQNIKSCTRKINPNDNCLVMTYPFPDIIRPELSFLKQKHLAGY